MNKSIYSKRVEEGVLHLQDRDFSENALRHLGGAASGCWRARPSL
jgi:hypothetical protein